MFLSRKFLLFSTIVQNKHPIFVAFFTIRAFSTRKYWLILDKVLYRLFFANTQKDDVKNDFLHRLCHIISVRVDALINPKRCSVQCAFGTMKGIVPYCELLLCTFSAGASRCPTWYGALFCYYYPYSAALRLRFIVIYGV